MHKTWVVEFKRHSNDILQAEDSMKTGLETRGVKLEIEYDLNGSLKVLFFSVYRGLKSVMKFKFHVCQSNWINETSPPSIFIVATWREHGFMKGKIKVRKGILNIICVLFLVHCLTIDLISSHRSNIQVQNRRHMRVISWVYKPRKKDHWKSVNKCSKVSRINRVPARQWNPD